MIIVGKYSADIIRKTLTGPYNWRSLEGGNSEDMSTCSSFHLLVLPLFIKEEMWESGVIMSSRMEHLFLYQKILRLKRFLFQVKGKRSEVLICISLLLWLWFYCIFWSTCHSLLNHEILKMWQIILIEIILQSIFRSSRDRDSWSTCPPCSQHSSLMRQFSLPEPCWTMCGSGWWLGLEGPPFLSPIPPASLNESMSQFWGGKTNVTS